jgi:hypothetical protein
LEQVSAFIGIRIHAGAIPENPRKIANISSSSLQTVEDGPKGNKGIAFGIDDPVLSPFLVGASTVEADVVLQASPLALRQ